MRGNFNNTGKLVVFTLRRERIISGLWIIILVLFGAFLAPGISSMFPTAAQRHQFAATFDNPVMVAMMGPVYGTDNYTIGAMYSGMMLLWVIIAVAVMNIFLVVRHTRADEERGRVEVVRSLPTGRLANLNATMITAVIVNAALGLLTGLALAAASVESMGFAASMLYGAVLCASGLVFAAIAALFSQLSSNKSGAIGMSFLVLGIFYILRAAGDMGLPTREIISCISPLGLAQRSQVYVENNLWPTLILLLEAVIISLVAYKLNSIRDMDQGFIHAKPGRSEASHFLRSPFGLALRLLRNTLIIWLIVMFTLGAAYGSVIGDIDQFVGESPQYLEVIGIPAEIVAQMTDADKAETIVKYFGVFVTAMMALISMIPLLMAAMKPRSEERDGRAEYVLAGAVSRVKHLSGYAVLAYAASALFPLATAVGLYASTAAVSGESNPYTLGGLLQSNLAYLPALWVTIGLAVFLIGILPKLSGAIWGIYGFVFFLSFVGRLILPDWLMHLSPMWYIPQAPLDKSNFLPLAVLTILAACLTASGFIFYKNRDMVTV